MADMDFDLFVIGAGSGGVRAARIAAGYGARVGIAESYRVGGTCVIRGCVPKKMLVYGARYAQQLQEAARFGWQIGDARFDWAVLRDHVLGEVERLEGLYRATLANHKVTLFESHARLTGANSVVLADGRTVTAARILIAVGGWPMRPDIPGAAHAITSNEVFHLETQPKRLLIAGGGFIANEFAGIFNALGSHVTVINRGDQILRGHDDQLRDRLLHISMGRGIGFRFNTQFAQIEENGQGLTAHFQDGSTQDADCILFATGRRPNLDGLALDAAGVVLNRRGGIQVDDDNRTNIASIYAVGDVTDRIQLTPMAIREGHAFADRVFGGKTVTVDYDYVPKAVFSAPPMAAVGLSEAEARARYGQVRVYSSDFLPIQNAMGGSAERALFKMVVDDATDVVLGLHMIGPDAPEILQAAAIAVRAGLTKADFDSTVALHPTMAEELVLMR